MMTAQGAILEKFGYQVYSTVLHALIQTLPGYVVLLHVLYILIAYVPSWHGICLVLPKTP